MLFQVRLRKRHNQQEYGNTVISEYEKNELKYAMVKYGVYEQTNYVMIIGIEYDNYLEYNEGKCTML